MTTTPWISTMEIALNELSPSKNKIIFIPDTNFCEESASIETIKLSDDMDVQSIAQKIGDNAYVGFVKSKSMNQTTLTNLVNLLICQKLVVIVKIDNSPTTCEIIYSKLGIGDSVIDGNYEYRYGQKHNYDSWIDVSYQKGWGVKVIDNTQTDYASPLTMLLGSPVTSISYLFHNSRATILNLINWDTSNIENMASAFNNSDLTAIKGLEKFKTSNVQNMSLMFADSTIQNLDLSSFETDNLMDTDLMFFESTISVVNAKDLIAAKRYLRSFVSLTNPKICIGDVEISL